MTTVMERLFNLRRMALREGLTDRGAEFRIGHAIARELAVDPRLRYLGDPYEILAGIERGDSTVFGLPMRFTTEADDYLGLVYEIRG